MTADDVAARWTSRVVLGDGEAAVVRPMTPADAPALLAFHERQSADSLYRRFFSPKPTLSEAELEHFTNVDFVDRAALVVESHGEFLAWASYERWPGRDDADTAFMVDDAHHGKGIATLLLEHLAAIATSNGIDHFTAEVLADNRPMLAVFSRAGWPLERHYDSGVIEVDFALDETAQFLDSMAKREQRADSRAMARLLMPRTIAVVGATDRPGTVGDALWRNVSSAATGPVYAVNPNRATVGDTPTYARLADIPDDVWLAVVAVPAAALADVLADCAAARVRGAVIATVVDNTDVDITALVADANRAGVRIIGPSSMGVASSRPEIGLQASLVPVRLTPGPIALSLQSGSLGSSVLRRLEQLHLGLSWFVSIGDRSDVSGNDLLQFWDDDENTKVIGLYTETLGNPRRFARIARRVSQRRPIVAVRTGTAASGPSGGALYQRSGLIEVPTVAALLDTLRVLATQPVLHGRNVAVLSNSRSPRTLAEAALVSAGLRPVAAPRPLDWRSTPADYTDAVRAALDDDGVDGVMVIHAPPLQAAIGAPVAEIDAAVEGATKPVTAVLLGATDGPIRRGSSVPGFAFPESAAAVLGRSYAYGHWLDTEAAAAPVTIDGVDDDAVDAVIADALARGPVSGDGRTLDVAETDAILRAYGITMPPRMFVPADDAVDAAAEVGYPVAIKARHRHPGRSVDAGVALDLADRVDVVSSVQRMRSALGDHADFVVVQAMTAPGVDLRIRVVADERAGPLVTVGIGGSQADLVDETPRLAPLSLESAIALLEESRAGMALQRAEVGSGFVIDIILRAAQLAAEHPEIVTLDLNPVIATQDRCCVTDAVIRVAPLRYPGATLRRL
ncbi:GNAT family N-acetyltransferase [Desertimonas flava]|uniref:GNAT family N-acetyltransferase n=1 Tax=Desertimonas flava TaxID=2064846 RepID=UPI000E34F60A|nr:GNAT family N-acetyltransferase [Desertimonas flava]